MSSTVFSKQTPSTVETRRPPTMNNDMEDNSQRPAKRRSLSGKFRSLFQKNSSPDRTASSERHPSSASPLPRQRSPSPETIRAATEAPHLRAPIVQWPFGKKKTKLTTPTTPTTANAPTSTKIKTKNSRKTKQKPPLPPTEISAPVNVNDYQTSIRGQNFVPKTPELAHGSTGRTQSSSSYETTTKGFRDYMIIDQSKSPQQAIPTNNDVITPPAYTHDRNRSPSPNQRPPSYANNEYPRYRSNSPISDNEVISPPQRTLDNTNSFTTTQIIAAKAPLLPQTYTSSSRLPLAPIPTNSDQWKGTSSPSLGNRELHPTVSSSMDIDAPKLHAPLVILGSKSNKADTNRSDSQSRSDPVYHSSTTINHPGQPNRPYAETHNFLPDTEIIHSGSSTPFKPIQSIVSTYPGLYAIVEHHMRPTTTSYNVSPSTITISPPQKQRYDASTTIIDDYDQQRNPQWSTHSIPGLSPSPPIYYHHDGYIRPLTPPRSSIHPDVTAIRIDPNTLRSPSQTTPYTSSKIPTYRSSTTLFTRDKPNYLNGGEIRTWSIRENDEPNSNQKSSTSVFIEPARLDHHVVPIKTTNAYQYQTKINEQEANSSTEECEEKYDVRLQYESSRDQQYSSATRSYSANRYFDKYDSANFTRPTAITERDRLYDQANYSYKDIGEFNSTKNSDTTLRHYTLERSDSYNGLGLVLTADVETRLNHRIRDIEPTSPSSRVGLRKNDRIITVNGVNVENIEFGDVLVLIKQGLDKNNLNISVLNEAVLL